MMAGRKALFSYVFVRVLTAGLGALSLHITYRIFWEDLFGWLRYNSGTQLLLEVAASILCVAAVSTLWFVVRPSERLAGYMGAGLHFLSFSLLLIGGGVSLILFYTGWAVVYLMTSEKKVAKQV